MRWWRLGGHGASQKLYLSPKTFGRPNQKTLLPQAKHSLPFFLGFSFYFCPICFPAAASSPPSSSTHVCAHTLPGPHGRCGGWRIPKPCHRQSNRGGS